MRKIYEIIGIVMILFVLLGCGPKKQTDNKGFNSKASLTSPVVAKTIQRNDLEEYITVSGTLSGIVDLVMISETSGKVIEIYKNLGDRVEKGEEIAKLDNDYIRIRYEQAQANQLSTEAAFEAAQANYNTSEMLSRDGRISKLEFDNAKTALKAAQGNLAGAQANTESAKLAYDNSRLVAPVSGYIAATDLGLGKVLSTGSVIVTIVDYTRLKLNTGVSESELFLIKKNQAVKIKSELTSVGLKGTVTGIGMKPLTGSSTYPIEIVADNQKGNYAPGMVVSASILARTYSDQIHIPLNVVLDDYGKKYVYLVDSDLKAKISYVTLGAIVNDQVIITEGLKEGDKLVTEGMEMLDEGASVEIKG